MSKKKRAVIIILSSVLALLICAGTGAYIWYINSPFTTVKKLADAITSKDADAVLECIEPDTARVIRQLMKLTGISGDELINKLLTDASDAYGSTDPEAPEYSFGLKGYERSGDNATVSLAIMNESGEERIIKIRFRRTDGTWYLVFSLG